MVSQIKQTGLRVHLITGNDPVAAKTIGEMVPFDELRARLTPLEKGEYIRMLNESDRLTAMVGNGIKDSPALVEAGMGIAMGGATDIAIAFSSVSVVLNSLWIGWG